MPHTYPGHISRPMKIEATNTQNLIRDGDSGIYYVRVKIAQRSYLRSLETESATTAKLRLPDKLKEIRDSVPQGEALGPLNRDSTFADAVEVYTKFVNENGRWKATTKEARLRPFGTLRRNWPELFEMQIRRVTYGAIRKYMADFEGGRWPHLPHRAKSKTVAGNSASSVNKLNACLREVFAVAVKAHVIAKNPANDLEAIPSKKKILHLPNKEQFKKIVLHVRTKAGRGRIAGDLVEGLAYSGMRVGESRLMEWQHLDFERDMMTVCGTKTYSSRRQIPMTAAFKELLLRMRERLLTLGKEPAPNDRVFEANEASVSLAKASMAVGMEKMVHHDLRDLFATTCIEAGVDIPTVAQWLGHDDGGVLAMKTYGHVRPAHSTEAAKLVRFS